MHFATTQGRGTQKLTIVGVLLDSRGGFVAGKQTDLDLNFTVPTFTQVAKAGLDVVITLEAPPGSYSVRAVARDARWRRRAALCKSGSRPRPLSCRGPQDAPRSNSTGPEASAASRQTCTPMGIVSVGPSAVDIVPEFGGRLSDCGSVVGALPGRPAREECHHGHSQTAPFWRENGFADERLIVDWPQNAVPAIISPGMSGSHDVDVSRQSHGSPSSKAPQSGPAQSDPPHRRQDCRSNRTEVDAPAKRIPR